VPRNFSKTSIAQKNKDRIAVTLRDALACFWIDASSQEVKAAGAADGAAPQENCAAND
jgi:hypothetical protein